MKKLISEHPWLTLYECVVFVLLLLGSILLQHSSFSGMECSLYSFGQIMSFGGKIFFPFLLLFALFGFGIPEIVSGIKDYFRNEDFKHQLKEGLSCIGITLTGVAILAAIIATLVYITGLIVRFIYC